MSFSSDCKTEMCKTPIEHECCTRAELYGCLLLGLRLTPDEIKILTEHSSFAKRLPLLLKRGFGLDFDASDMSGRKTQFAVTSPEKLSRILTFYGHDEALRISVSLNRGAIEDECCVSAFARGMFLTGGYTAHPDKEYHLEILTPHLALSRQLTALLSELDLPPKNASRAGHQVLYYKNSEMIEDFLTLCGAPLRAMSVMEAKVEKDVRNNVNRKVNCEAANLEKTVSAGIEQCKAINKLISAGILDKLPEQLRQTAALRLKYPEDTLDELAERAGISKSGMNHRLRKLINIGGSQHV